MWPGIGGMDEQGNVLIPFTMGHEEIPFQRWQMVSTKVWDSPGPVVVRSIILTNDGQLFVQYAKEVNDANEYPTESTTEVVVESHRTSTTIPGESLIESDEKRSYE
jgi:hypothetical protein